MAEQATIQRKQDAPVQRAEHTRSGRVYSPAVDIVELRDELLIVADMPGATNESIDVNFGAYAASKSALATATKTLARELGRDGVRVNGIHPGYIWGDSVEWYLKHLAEQNGTTFDIEYAKVADQTCLGYIVPSSEIAGTVVYLASELAKPVTGQAISVNGGSWLS